MMEVLATPHPAVSARVGSAETGSRSRVLVAEDDPICRTILSTWLKTWGYETAVAEDGASAWDILQQGSSPQLLILDWIMPGIDGTELCRRVRERLHGSYHYILLVTANDAKKEIVSGLESGADDYLTKPFDVNELRARLRVGERTLALHDQLRFQATHDALTGTWNRGASLESLERELERAKRTNASTGVLLLDVDHFKQINDTYGHLVGDAVLREIAHRISRVVRVYDLLGRYGGEEFIVVLPDCKGHDVRDTAERIRMAIANEPFHFAGEAISVTVSVGTSLASRNNLGVKQILGGADDALYAAKHAGRNCVMAAVSTSSSSIQKVI